MADCQLHPHACETTNSARPDGPLLDAWERRKAAWQRCEALPSSDIIEATAEEAECMAIVDAAEVIICNTIAATPRGIACQLWVSLDYSADAHDLGMADAIRREDIASVCAMADGLDWEARLMVAALRSALAQEGQ